MGHRGDKCLTQDKGLGQQIAVLFGCLRVEALVPQQLSHPLLIKVPILSPCTIFQVQYHIFLNCIPSQRVCYP